MFPGCFYLLGMWYKRGEAQKRFTFFFCSTSLAGAFGGLLASAIGKSELVLAEKMNHVDCVYDTDEWYLAQWMVFVDTAVGGIFSSSREPLHS